MVREEKEHLRIEQYCILCRHSLPVEQYSKSIFQQPGFRAKLLWDADVLCFLNVPRLDQAPVAASRELFRVNFSSHVMGYGHETLRKTIQEGKFNICHRGIGCRRCRPGVWTNFVHLHCYKLAKKSIPALTVHDLVRIGRLTSTILPWTLSPALSNVIFQVPESVLSDDASSDGDLGRLLTSMHKRLPLELQYHILSDTPDFFQSSLAGETNLKQVYPFRAVNNKDKAGVVTYPLSDVSVIKKLGANTVNILGDACFTEIGTGERTWKHEISIRDVKIQAIQVTFGLYGAVALRILYEDGMPSEWLGETQGRWYKRCKGSELQNLKTYSDGYKIVAVDLAEPGTDPTTLLTRALWDRDMPPSSDRIFPLFETVPPEHQTPSESKLRYIQHLSFEEIGEIHCITMFCSPPGISSIQINGDPKHQIGLPWFDSFPVTHYFDSGETIEAVYTLTIGQTTSIKSGPFIALITSSDRTLFFGPYGMPLHETPHVSSVVDFQEYKPIGFIIDPTTGIPQKFTSFGVAAERRDPLTQRRVKKTVSIPHILRLNDALMNRDLRGTYLGRANFTDISSLELQTRNGECVGLFVGHRDSHHETLGQWDPSKYYTIRHVWDEGCGRPLSSIVFQFSRHSNPRERRVLDISDTQTTQLDENDFIWEPPNSEVAWCFHEDFDRIEPWNGTTIELERDSVGMNTTFME